ncbi:inositol monophosphatase family protein [Guptibacillus hwajinpoensis]|uniref:inositol-phosphate phosphatase n=2 Tax=Guptibacillus hwajinpoensis TaxID=208199 RepID=A0A0J6D0F4_9BACL|nr:MULTISPECIES: inositol monophosphatase family protein [Alkalihalobacillus]KMM38815.1 inositol monophosphatase [Alkalihalobacillus macyae]MDQ0482734.1 myo-inositol-1(or 4)-monophosphatase [Alkalihalobacillus hemicentroti]
MTLETNWNQIYEDAKGWIREAGEEIIASFTTSFAIDTKSNPNDLVTDIDKETEKFFIERIKKIYPSHRIMGEEGFGDQVEDLSGVIWFLDPIDGTMNFVHQQTNFAISIGIYEDGVGKAAFIYDVTKDELYHCSKGTGLYLNNEKLKPLEPVKLSESLLAINATWVTENHRIDPRTFSPLLKKIRGTRSYGSAAIEMAYVAAGRLDGYVSLRLAPWDFAAGKLLIEEAGGVCTTVDNKPINLLDKNTIFVGNETFHSQVQKDYIQPALDQNYYLKTPSTK